MDEQGSGGVSPGIGRGLFQEGMGPSSSLAHLYRAEVHRMTRWRERMDRTTNWSVIIMAAIMTWAFASPDRPHYLVLVGGAMVTVFLMIEAHRYRSYDIWRTRVRILQENVFAHALSSDELRDKDWPERLGRDYREPTMGMTFEEAVAHRLRRVYLWLYSILLAAWVVRITVFTDSGWPASASVGQVPGQFVAVGVGLPFALAIVIAFRPRTWHGRGELRNGFEL